VFPVRYELNYYIFRRNSVFKGSIRGLNLAAVMHTTVQVTRLPF
jgi:hypothetical protein